VLEWKKGTKNGIIEKQKDRRCSEWKQETIEMQPSYLSFVYSKVEKRERNVNMVGKKIKKNEKTETNETLIFFKEVHLSR
jgi:hypothetical protein